MNESKLHFINGLNQIKFQTECIDLWPHCIDFKLNNSYMNNSLTLCQMNCCVRGKYSSVQEKVQLMKQYWVFCTLKSSLYDKQQ